MNNENQIAFRTDSNGNLITVSEINTKIKYIHYKTFAVGRLAVTIEVVSLSATLKARIAYFMYNNRVSRSKRAVVAAYKLAVRRAHFALASKGIQIRLTY